MSENEQGTFKPQFGAELNIESIIGAPLVAASKANVMMLTGQAQFLLDYCFTKRGGKQLATTSYDRDGTESAGC